MLLKQKKYNDTFVKLFGSLFCSHFIEAMGRPEGFFELIFRKSYWIALVSGFAIAYILWELVSRITVWLDNQYDWLQQTVQRIFLQLLLAFCLPAALLYILTYLQMRWLFHQDIIQVQYLTSEFPAACLLIIIINAYYLIYYFYNRTVAASTESFKTKPIVSAPLIPESTKEEKKPNTILVNKGAKTVPLPADGIACIYKDGEHTFIKTFDGETFFTAASLDELENRLDEHRFFRANRQTIVHRKACQSFSPAEYGKLKLQLQPEPKEPVIVSQKKAAAYRQWLQNGA